MDTVNPVGEDASSVSIDIEQNQKPNIKPPPPEEDKVFCRICHCSSEDVDSDSVVNGKQQKKKKKIKPSPSSCGFMEVTDPCLFISPCFCTGSLRYVHHDCLQKWIRSSNHKYCELCKYNFNLKVKSRPIYQVIRSIQFNVVPN